MFFYCFTLFFEFSVAPQVEVFFDSLAQDTLTKTCFSDPRAMQGLAVVGRAAEGDDDEAKQCNQQRSLQGNSQRCNRQGLDHLRPRSAQRQRYVLEQKLREGTSC